MAMPVQLLGRIGVVVDIDNDPLTFLEAQQGAGKLPVIGGGRNDAIRRQFDQPIADPDRLIRGILGRCGWVSGRLSLDRFGERCRQRCHSTACSSRRRSIVMRNLRRNDQIDQLLSCTIEMR
jgi:hypothetical protein